MADEPKPARYRTVCPFCGTTFEFGKEDTSVMVRRSQTVRGMSPIVQCPNASCRQWIEYEEKYQ